MLLPEWKGHVVRSASVGRTLKSLQSGLLQKMSDVRSLFPEGRGKKEHNSRKEEMRSPGVEPGTQAWKACMLTITPRTLRCEMQSNEVGNHLKI